MAAKSAEPSSQATRRTTGEFTMRPMEVSDTDQVAQWYQIIEDVSIFDRQIPLPMNHADVTTFIRSLVSDQEKAKSRWFIAENSAGTAVGMVGLESVNLLHGHAILPLFVAKPWRRSGVGIRMACMIIDLAFKQLRLHRVATFYRADNTASGALLKRLGFSKEGTARESWFSDGQHFDLINVGLLLDEWEMTRSTLLTELSPAVIVGLGQESSSWCWPPRV